jgi:hypothetical protein
MSVKALLGRVQRLEAARKPRLSPFTAIYGTFEQFEAECRAEMVAGKLDRDFPIEALARWETDGTWANAQGRWR